MTDIAKWDNGARDMTIPAPHGVTDPTGGRLVAWAEGLAAAHRIGAALCQTTFVPQHFRGKPEEAAAAILYGDEIGFTPTQALQNLYVIGGKPALYARAMVALVQAAGHAVWTEEKTDETCTVVGVRRGTTQEVRETWTLARAQRAGYTNNKKYQTDPQAMLYARAASDVCRQIAADVLAGIGYSVEEMQLVEDERPAPAVKSPGLAGLRAAVTQQPQSADDGITHSTEPEPQGPQQEQAEDEPRLTKRQQGKLFALFNQKGIPEHEQAPGMAHILGREITSRTAITSDEFDTIVTALESRPDVEAQS